MNSKEIVLFIQFETITSKFYNKPEEEKKLFEYAKEFLKDYNLECKEKGIEEIKEPIEDKPKEETKQTKEQPTNKELSKSSQTEETKSKRQPPPKEYTYSRKDILDTFNILNLEKYYEIRTLDLNKANPKSKCESKDNIEELLRFIRLYNGERYIFIGINERKTNKFNPSKKDIDAIKTIIIDIDAEKEEGFEEYTATEEEYKQTLQKGHKIIEYLKTKFEDINPSIAKSGSGTHIYIPIETILINEENFESIHAKNMLFQTNLREVFKDIKMDNMGDLPRAIRLIGTLNKKTKENNERKPQLSYWVEYNGRERESKTLKEHILNLKIEKTINQDNKTPSIEIDFECEEECIELLKSRQTCPALINAYKKIMLGEHSHEEKIGVLNYLLKKNFIEEEIHVLLKNSKTYNRQKLEDKLKEIKKYNYMPPNCIKWESWGLCNKKEGCKKTISPLYFIDINEYQIFTCLKCKEKYTAQQLNDNLFVCKNCLKINKKEEKPYVFKTTHIINEITDFLCKKYILKTRIGREEILSYEQEGKYKGIYTRAENIIRKEFVNFDKIISHPEEKKIIEKIKNRTLIDNIYFNPRYLIPLNNCVIDIRTWEEKEHNPEFNLTRKLFRNLPKKEKDRTTPTKFDKFLETITWEEQKIERQMLKEFIAVTLLPNSNYPLGLFLHGTGRNGKGMYIYIVKTFFNGNELLEEGEKHPKEHELHEPLTPHELSHKEGKFKVHLLEDKWLVCSDEVPSYSIGEDSRLKEILEGKELHVEDKHISGWSIIPRCTALWGSNELPKIDNCASPWFTRIKLMFLPFKFDDRFKDAVDYMGRKVYRTPRKKEEILHPIIKDEEEMNAILYQSLEILKEICMKGHLTDLTLNEKIEMYEQESNPISTFLKRTTKFMEGGFISNNDLLHEYKKYCESIDTPKANDRKFYKEINEYWREKYAKCQITNKEGGRPRGWYGVGWNEEYKGHGETPEKRIQKRNSCKVDKEVGVDLDNHYKKLFEK